MTICTSGDNLNTKLSSTGWITNLHIAIEAYKYFSNQHEDDTFSEREIEVHYCDLTEDNVFGWCERVDEDSWLIHIHNDLQIVEHYKTLFHEFTHIVQAIYGLSDNHAREYEAHKLEELYYDQFITTEASKVSP